jgi:hypothetical protein
MPRQPQDGAQGLCAGMVQPSAANSQPFALSAKPRKMRAVAPQI